MPIAIEFIILLDMVCVIISLFLLYLCWSALRIIKAKKIERTIFMPLLIAGFLFFATSAFGMTFGTLHLTIFEEVVDPLIFEVLHHISLAIALLIVTYGVYNYWRMLRKLP
ncbi:hypothetical protein KEJ26_06520 [Candidatus Bathyarchaeota archaeon]|nr:hypothetical protein [Candidatus Bathyarchaeota archaeon]